MFIIGRIIGLIFTIATFPGVIIHEIAHRFFCDITKTPVYDIKYFEISNDLNSAGFVKHGQTNGLRTTALVCLGPLIINTFLCLIFTTPYAITIAARAGNILGFSHIILLWLGFSMGAHAIPSSQDVSNLTEYISQNHSIFVQIIYFPIRILFFITRLLSFFWFDTILAFLMIWGNVKFYTYILDHISI